MIDILQQAPKTKFITITEANKELGIWRKEAQKKQFKTDDSLKTTEKTIVKAINEIREVCLKKEEEIKEIKEKLKELKNHYYKNI